MSTKFVEFNKPISLSWPASSEWYHFLEELHRALSRDIGFCYADKDIIIPSNLVFQADGYYEYLSQFDIAMIRFNERGAARHLGRETSAPLNPRPGYRITLRGTTRICGFDYERLTDSLTDTPCQDQRSKVD